MTTHKEALEAAYLAGFNASGEGYNGEYPFGDKMQDPAKNPAWKKDRDNYIKEALAQPEQEPTNLERHERNVQQLFGTPQPKEQEPVAHVCVFPLRGDEFFPQTRIEWKNGRPVAGPLYTTPPQRTWVGLTDDEFQLIYDMGRTPAGMMEMVEAKLKEKNNA